MIHGNSQRQSQEPCIIYGKHFLFLCFLFLVCFSKPHLLVVLGKPLRKVLSCIIHRYIITLLISYKIIENIRRSYGKTNWHSKADTKNVFNNNHQLQQSPNKKSKNSNPFITCARFFVQGDFYLFYFILKIINFQFTIL